MAIDNSILIKNETFATKLYVFSSSLRLHKLHNVSEVLLKHLSLRFNSSPLARSIILISIQSFCHLYRKQYHNSVTNNQHDFVRS